MLTAFTMSAQNRAIRTVWCGSQAGWTGMSPAVRGWPAQRDETGNGQYPVLTVTGEMAGLPGHGDGSGLAWG